MGPQAGDGTWPDDYGTYTDAWDTTTATNNMEAIIDKAVADGNPIEAVLAENDSTALGVAAALTGKNYDPYPPVSGQDGDPANLNNVAKGLQYVDVWKNANELGKATGAAALALCANPDMDSPGAAGRPDRRDRRAGQSRRPAVHHAGWQHGELLHSQADATDRREPAGGGRR